MPKRIVILTGGGDVPGLNAVIKQVTYRGLGMDFEVLGVRRGWEGLTHLNLDDPDSKVSKLLAENRHFRMHEELGSGPGFFYLWDKVAP
ncbi:MAG: 6-phosphofructokinase [Rubrivivax sp.]|nr:6-phosphofructokinase [Rubrivivax sp.]